MAEMEFTKWQFPYPGFGDLLRIPVSLCVCDLIVSGLWRTLSSWERLFWIFTEQKTVFHSLVIAVISQVCENTPVL